MPKERREYDTGAARSADCEQTRYDLISPIGLRRLAETYAEGAAKFGQFNWENGMPVTDLLNHALAHVYKFLGGDRAEDHLAHAAWNLLGAIHSLELWPEMNQQFLRGPGCTCPPAAQTEKQAQREQIEQLADEQLTMQKIGECVYAVGNAAPDAANKVDQLRRMILGQAAE